MTRTKLTTVTILCVFSLFLMVSLSAAAGPSLDQWKPAFDPTGAKYKATISNVSHPAIRGVYFGFALRDELWKRTNGQIFIDYKPFSMLGGEVEVLNQLQMGALQGMGVSSVTSTNLGPRFGVVNLPFLVDSFDKLDKFVANETLFNHFMSLDITGYGNYGWATMSPCKTIADAKKLKIRIAEAAVNQLIYKSWGFNPVVMPWPDVSISLKQGVIDGLDHTPTVCNITKKFEDAKFFTQINYAQGLFIWVISKSWFNTLTPDLQKIFKETAKEIAAKIRQESRQQEIDEIEKAKAAGIQFFKLSDEEMKSLNKQGDSVHKQYAAEINKLYDGDKYRPANYLKEVQDFLGYQP